MLRALLLATSMLCADPALAAIDPPAANEDKRIRIVPYDPNNPVVIYTAPGTTLRIELGADETVSKVLASDQGIISPNSYVSPPPPSGAAQASLSLAQPQQQDPWPSSCDQYLCKVVVGNFIYLKPLVETDPQPLFVQTWRPRPTVADPANKEYVAYTFEFYTVKPAATPPPTRVADASQQTVPQDKKPSVVWGVRFVYPDRVKAQAAALQAQRRNDAAQAARDKPKVPQVTTAVADVNANWRYGYRGAASVMPDAAWDDGRTTFIRFNGNRRVPNIYNRLPDGHESIPAVAPEPDATGNTLRIAHTDKKWFIRDGDEAGCLFDLGPDPEGKTAATTVAAYR